MLTKEDYLKIMEIAKDILVAIINNSADYGGIIDIDPVLNKINSCVIRILNKNNE